MSAVTLPRLILFVGAHHDDIEIGAGGTLARVTLQGIRHHCLVITEDISQPKRSEETLRALSMLGVGSENVSCLQLKDGFVQTNGDSVHKLRQHLQSRNLEPDYVVCHSTSDSHNDHRATASLLRAALRRVTILGYYVPYSGEAGFEPSVVVDVTAHHARKQKAIQAHTSQRERLSKYPIDSIGKQWGKLAGVARAEAFDVLTQEGACTAWLPHINSIPTARFASAFPAGRPITILKPSAERPIQHDTTTIYQDIGAADDLVNALVPWTRHRNPVSSKATSRLSEINSDLGDHTIIVGGAAANLANLAFIDHIKALRWRIAYDWPGYSDIRIEDNRTRRIIRAKYSVDKSLVMDRGIVTFAKGIINDGAVTISSAGIHGPATRAIVRGLLTSGPHGLLDAFLTFTQDSEVVLMQLLVNFIPGVSKLSVAMKHAVRSNSHVA